MKQCIIKFLTIVAVWMAFVSVGMAQQPNPTQQFYNGVNSNWQSQNYTQLLVLINTRLQSNSNDIWALLLKANFYVFAQKDITQAHQAATSFLSVVNAGTTNQTLKDQAQQMANLILNIPTSESTPYTSAQITSLHSLFTNFPYNDEGLVFWGKFTGQL